MAAAVPPSASHELVLGKKYKHGLDGLQCSLGFMLLRGVLDKKGRVIASKVAKIPREHLWGYVWWLRENNKCLRPFQVVEKKKRLSRLQLIRLVEPRYLKDVKKVKKTAVLEFINHVINKYSPKIDFVLDGTTSSQFIKSFQRKKKDALSRKESRPISLVDRIRTSLFPKSDNGKVKAASKGSLEAASKGSLEAASKGSLEAASKGSLEASQQAASKQSLEVAKEAAIKASEEAIQKSLRDAAALKDNAMREVATLKENATREAAALKENAAREAAAIKEKNGSSEAAPLGAKIHTEVEDIIYDDENQDLTVKMKVGVAKEGGKASRLSTRRKRMA